MPPASASRRAGSWRWARARCGRGARRRRRRRRSPPPGQQIRRNSISGHVFGDSRRPLSDVFVELLDDLGVTVNRTRTTPSGRYEFAALPEGRFKVRVLPYGTDYGEQVQEVIISNVSALGGGTGGEIQQRDFYLNVRADLNSGPFAAPGTVFAQEVPEAARKLYEKASGELRAKKEKEGFESLRNSLDVFPDYFLALDRLGTEYAVRGNSNAAYFEAARVLLMKAVKVNPASFSSTFGLGFAQYHLGWTNEAVETLQRAVKLYGKSVNGHLWLGIALKKAGKLSEAEVSLNRANKVGDGKVAEVHLRLAELYSEQKRYKESADALELYLKNQKDARDAEKIRQLIAQLRQKASAK
ncbi:MAG: carboxypeptidase regulatory-like domain-containing protein [Acidobacteria bacterium]|nr:carboxypeptidase regulatory-like domain-containing protein [Acidobacteriota bacterium]